MAQITLKGTPIHTTGDLPSTGSSAPDFRLTKSDLSDVGLDAYAGKKKILNIVPSLDTGVCAASARRFNEEASKLDNTAILTVSADLPFAQARFCEVEGIKNVEALSMLRDKSFGKDYGIEIADGPMAGVLGRAIVVLDENNKVVYTELVPEIVQEPDYEKALAAVK